VIIPCRGQIVLFKEISLSNLKQNTDSQNSDPRGKVSEQIAKEVMGVNPYIKREENSSHRIAMGLFFEHN